MVEERELREQNILRLIISFSGPAIAGMMMMSIYNIVDRIFIGQGVGAMALAGLTIAFPLMIIKGSLGVLVGTGAAALLSIRMGQGRKEEAEKILGNAITLMVLVGLFMTVLGLVFTVPLMRLFGASETVLPYAVTYTRIIMLGNVFHIISMGANNFIRAEGSPRTSMVTNFIGGGTNIILDFIFIIALQWGVAGAAVATILSQFIASCWVIRYYVRDMSHLKLQMQNLRISFARTAEIVNVGLPQFLRMTLDSLIIITINNSLQSYGGDLHVSAMGIIFSLNSVLIMPLMGLSNGAQPVIGFNYGAQQFRRVKQAIFSAIGLSTGFVLLVFITVQLAPGFFIRMFTPNQELIALGSQGLRLFLMAIPVLGFQIIGANYFQATGRAMQSILLNMSRQVIFLLPLLLILPRFVGARGVWMAPPIADIIAFMLTAVFIVFEVKDLNRKQSLSDQES